MSDVTSYRPIRLASYVVVFRFIQIGSVFEFIEIAIQIKTDKCVFVWPHKSVLLPRASRAPVGGSREYSVDMFRKYFPWVFSVYIFRQKINNTHSNNTQRTLS